MTTSTITEALQPQAPQALPTEAAFTNFTKRLLASPHIAQEHHAQIQATLEKRTSLALADIVCRVLWPPTLQLLPLQNEAENILKDHFGIKDPTNYISTYYAKLREASLFAVKYAAIDALFREAEALMLQLAQATDDDRVTLYEQLQAKLLKLNDSRDTMTKEAHAKADALNTKVNALLPKALQAGDEAEVVSQRLQGIRIASTANAHDAKAFAGRLTK